MPVTITYQNIKPVVGGSADTWGTTLNTQSDETKTDLEALAAVVNTSEPLAANALPRSGGTMTGPIVLDSAGPSSPYAAGFRGAPVVSVTGAKTLALSGAGTMQRNSGPTVYALTIPPNGTVAFPIGTTLALRNASSAFWTMTRGVGVALRLAGSSTDADANIATYGLATLVKEDTNAWVLSGVGIS